MSIYPRYPRVPFRVRVCVAQRFSSAAPIIGWSFVTANSFARCFLRKTIDDVTTQDARHYHWSTSPMQAVNKPMGLIFDLLRRPRGWSNFYTLHGCFEKCRDFLFTQQIARKFVVGSIVLTLSIIFSGCADLSAIAWVWSDHVFCEHIILFPAPFFQFSFGFISSAGHFLKYIIVN